MVKKAKRVERGKPCPRCSSTETTQMSNYGHPIRGRFQCFGCKRSWDELNETAPDYVRPQVDVKVQRAGLEHATETVRDIEEKLQEAPLPPEEDTRVKRASDILYGVHERFVQEQPTPRPTRKRLPPQDLSDEGGQKFIEAAIAHGEATKDVALEGADLADVFLVAWKLMTREQRADLLAQDEARDVLAWLPEEGAR